MRFEDALERLPEEPLTPRDKLLAALEMYDEGVARQRLSLKRQNPPSLYAEEIEKQLPRRRGDARFTRDVDVALLEWASFERNADVVSGSPMLCDSAPRSA